MLTDPIEREEVSEWKQKGEEMQKSPENTANERMNNLNLGRQWKTALSDYIGEGNATKDGDCSWLVRPGSASSLRSMGSPD